eukprot:5178984-Alexandrium_andersonii.AAC.1
MGSDGFILSAERIGEVSLARVRVLLIGLGQLGGPNYHYAGPEQDPPPQQHGARRAACRVEPCVAPRSQTPERRGAWNGALPRRRASGCGAGLRSWCCLGPLPRRRARPGGAGRRTQHCSC